MEPLGLNFADWFILVILVASGIISFSRGFTKEFLSLFLWISAFVAAISLEFLATPNINQFIGNEEVSKVISYVFVFVLFLFIGRIVINLISKIIKWTGSSGFDRFLGILFGLTRGLIFIFVIFLLLPSNLKTTELLTNSKITPIVEKYAPKIEEYFRNLIDNRNNLEETLEKADLLQNIKSDLDQQSTEGDN
tara:strand:- start:1409 stop:1987 length:579 start_codon:yes stop_codon:yes gene_type:complete